MGGAILALNAGSSSVKFALYDVDASQELQPVSRGALDLGDTPRLTARAADGSPLCDRLLADSTPQAGFHELLRWIGLELGGRELAACGHRIVHGGPDFADPVRLTPSVVEAVTKLTPLAPLHQPGSLMSVHALAELRPDLVQIGCFDTAYHRTIGRPASRFALPRKYEEKGIRRYGFHGLSYEYIAGRLKREGKADQRTVVAHLGNGASLCAMKDEKSLDTTMGFSALDGLVMGTRCGALDPGVLLHLLIEEGMRPQDLQRLLYEEAGLLGVSGISGDMRTLEASSDPRASEAVELFAFRAAREVAALASTLGGLDCLVFTAGIGERSAGVRKAICERLEWLGASVDEAANGANASLISAPDARVEVRIIPTDEEIVIARHTLKALSRS